MKQFALIFRLNLTSKEKQPTPEQMKVYMKDWSQWIENISKQDKLVDGNHFSPEGRVINADKTQTKGPYVADKLSVAGYIIVQAKNLDEAISITKDCPILGGEGNSVEIRELASPGK